MFSPVIQVLIQAYSSADSDLIESTKSKCFYNRPGRRDPGLSGKGSIQSPKIRKRIARDLRTGPEMCGFDLKGSKQPHAVSMRAPARSSGLSHVEASQRQFIINKVIFVVYNYNIQPQQNGERVKKWS